MKKEQKNSITKEVSEVCTKQRNTLHSLQSQLEPNRHEERNIILLTESELRDKKKQYDLHQRYPTADKIVALSHKNKTSKGKTNSYATVIRSGINKIPHKFGCSNILHDIRLEYLSHISVREKINFPYLQSTDIYV